MKENIARMSGGGFSQASNFLCRCDVMSSNQSIVESLARSRSHSVLISGLAPNTWPLSKLVVFRIWNLTLGIECMASRRKVETARTARVSS